MFNKKFLFVSCVFLLFILQISFVSAQNDNQTGIQNKSCEYFEINNDFSQNFQNNVSTNDFDVIELYQGEIPIHIDSPSDGEVTVLIDGNNYGVWDFTKNEIIHIPTYNSESFHNNSKANIDIGLHNLSLIFSFNNFISKDANTFLDENSILNFKFNEDNPYMISYRYNSTLNILKKDKTIHISNFTYYNLLKPAQCIINIDNLEKYYDEEYVFSHLMGIIIKNNKHIYKESIYGLDNPIIIDSDIYEEGIYNFTVINFIDGTMDSLLFKANKYQPKMNINYIINGNSIKINLMNQTEYYNDWADITVDNITKELPLYLYEENNWNVSFENLSSGVHTLKIENLGDYRTEDFYYITSFVIKDSFDFDNENNNTIQQNIEDTNTSFMKENITSVNSSFIKGNTTSNNSRHPGEFIKNNGSKNSPSIKNTLNSKETVKNSKIGYDTSVQSNSIFQTKKSHEIIKKAIPKIKNDMLPFYLIIIVIILLIIGYFKYHEKI